MSKMEEQIELLDVDERRHRRSHTLKQHRELGVRKRARLRLLEGLALEVLEDRGRERRDGLDARNRARDVEARRGREGALARARAGALGARRARVRTERRGNAVVDVELGVVEAEDRLGVRGGLVVASVDVGRGDSRLGDDDGGGDSGTARDRGALVVGERVNLQNELAQAVEGDALGRVEGEDLAEDRQTGVGDGEDAAQEVGVPQEGGERLVARGGAAPRVPSADEVDEDDTERPDVGRARGVARGTVAPLSEALGCDVEGRAATELGRSRLGGGQTEVDDAHTGAVVRAYNVLRLDVAVGDAELVQPVDTIEDLQEDGPDKVVVAGILVEG